MARPDHVLIVDDAEIRALLSEYLQRNGYRASAVADGKSTRQRSRSAWAGLAAELIAFPHGVLACRPRLLRRQLSLAV